MHDAAYREAKEAIDFPHPLRIALCKVIVHSNDVNAVARERVQICRKRFGDGFSFTGFHFRNATLVQHNTAQKLHIEMSLPDGALCCLAHNRKGLRQKAIQRFARAEPLLEFHGLCAQRLIRKRMQFRFQLIDPAHLRHQLFDSAFARIAEQFIDKAHFFCLSSVFTPHPQSATV